MSEHVVHFHQGDAAPICVRHDDSILSEQWLMAGGKFGVARGLGGLGDTQESFWLSEVPLDRLDRVVDRRGTKYGVGFR